MTNLPAGSGHLAAETCPLAESAAAPCRSDSCWRTKGVQSCAHQSIYVHDSQTHALRSNVCNAPHLKYRRQMSHSGKALYAHHTCMIAHELYMEAMAALHPTCRTWAYLREVKASWNVQGEAWRTHIARRNEGQSHEDQEHCDGSFGSAQSSHDEPQC